jgi:SPP1 gp7 family putative phage head morphogenesis protein
MPLDRDGTQFVALMEPSLRFLFKRAWDDTMEELGIDVPFNLNNPLVAEAMQARRNLLKNVPQNLFAYLRGIVVDGTQRGLSPAEIAQELLDKGALDTVTRATRVARTESAWGYEAASHLAWRASEQVRGSEWLNGPNPCPDCQAINGKVVALGEEFAPGVRHAPYHPECTCSTAPVLT